MTRRRTDELALRREALTARAALQRIELKSAVAQLRHRSLATRGLAAVALRAAAGLAGAPRTAATVSAGIGRPWLASAGWLAWRALRASPTARWAAGAVVLGAAVWWVARSVRAPDGAAAQASDDGASPDDSG